MEILPLHAPLAFWESHAFSHNNTEIFDRSRIRSLRLFPSHYSSWMEAIPATIALVIMMML